eukprot:TRINITY_DN4_c0_g1_i1.p1 TRINITY_DN4_c0_g1~~TRINITY_DN4_c0_g1_i1.p1  ORF type:complete len:131 (-),score=47.78 TRINITY_DN4_c0_g1_i1:165-557(-)
MNTFKNLLPMTQKDVEKAPEYHSLLVKEKIQEAERLRKEKQMQREKEKEIRIAIEKDPLEIEIYEMRNLSAFGRFRNKMKRSVTEGNWKPSRGRCFQIKVGLGICCFLFLAIAMMVLVFAWNNKQLLLMA